ncbi:winged helix-turn-helix transcriptional regulator [Phreatobacter aquaticus]|uniref:Winged helix-turn-helix transcriptional regulator n=1 Tax=Phreatobacter aquaticus TaxID=2570229 RepID=A0A4D7QCV1_9HYPH|nr:MarR family winged helix-turn-helix transcriptional regulator [Phreatobacter aquaticus]QCK85830.1 winged helix-turn-helix transcriptional regulator [Phreatobacter aquaticus]
MSPRSHGRLELETFLPYRLNVLASVVSQGLSSVYAERYGIGIPEWRVMATLGQFGTLTAKVIGAHSRMHKTKVSRAVAALSERDLLERRANEQDLRAAFLTLSPAGRAIYDDLVPVAKAYAEALTEGLNAGERAVLDRLVTALTERGLRLMGAPLDDTSDA